MTPLFDGAWDMIAPIAGALGQISCESTVIIYSPVADRSFSLLTRKARHIICFLVKGRTPHGWGRVVVKKICPERGEDDARRGDE